MSEAPTSSLRLRPPPGPLAWLHSELQGLRLGAASEEPELDLGRKPLLGDALLADVKAQSAALRVEGGPRGRALVAWLAARGVRAELLSDDDSFEGRLHTAARAPSVETLVLTDGAEPRALPLSLEGAEAARAAAAEGPSAWILVLHPGDGLAAELTARLARLDADAALLSAARDAGLLPVICAPAAPAAPVPPARATTRLPPTWWGVLPGDELHPVALLGLRALLARLQPARRLRYLALETLALAGVDLWSERLAGRWSDPLPTLPTLPTRAVVIAVDGIDGAGKSAHATALHDALAARGLPVRTARVFRHGVFHDTLTDLQRRCVEGRGLHLWRLQRLVKAFDSLKALAGPLRGELDAGQVLIFDRWLVTHLADGPARLLHEPGARELLAPCPRPEAAFLLDLPSEDALARLRGREQRSIDENPVLLAAWRERLRLLAPDEKLTVLDARAPFARNHAPPLQHALPPSAPAPPAPTAEELLARAPFRLVVGPRAAAPALFPPDAEYRAAMAALAPLVACGRLPLEIVLHLYAAELLERAAERLVAGGGTWSAPFWPAALFAAAGLHGHAAHDLQEALPIGLAVELQDVDEAEVSGAAAGLFGGWTPDAAALRAATAEESRRLPEPARFPYRAADGPAARATSAALLVRDGRVLLERRADSARVAPGAWDSPGGHLAAGETAATALERELREELGVRALDARPVALLDETDAASGTRYRHVVHVVRRFEGEPAPREGQTLAWLRVREALARDGLHPLTGHVLEQLRGRALLPD